MHSLVIFFFEIYVKLQNVYGDISFLGYFSLKKFLLGNVSNDLGNLIAVEQMFCLEKTQKLPMPCTSKPAIRKSFTWLIKLTSLCS